MAVMMKTFGRVDNELKVSIPKNMAREAGLTPGQLVEIKVAGAATDRLGGRFIQVTAKRNTVS